MDQARQPYEPPVTVRLLPPVKLLHWLVAIVPLPSRVIWRPLTVVRLLARAVALSVTSNVELPPFPVKLVSADRLSWLPLPSAVNWRQHWAH